MQSTCPQGALLRQLPLVREVHLGELHDESRGEEPRTTPQPRGCGAKRHAPEGRLPYSVVGAGSSHTERPVRAPPEHGRPDEDGAVQDDRRGHRRRRRHRRPPGLSRPANHSCELAVVRRDRDCASLHPRPRHGSRRHSDDTHLSPFITIATKKETTMDPKKLDSKIDDAASKTKDAAAKATAKVAEVAGKAGHIAADAATKVEKLAKESGHRIQEAADKVSDVVEDLGAKARSEERR